MFKKLKMKLAERRREKRRKKSMRSGGPSMGDIYAEPMVIYGPPPWLDKESSQKSDASRNPGRR